MTTKTRTNEATLETRGDGEWLVRRTDCIGFVTLEPSGKFRASRYGTHRRFKSCDAATRWLERQDDFDPR